MFCLVIIIAVFSQYLLEQSQPVSESGIVEGSIYNYVLVLVMFNSIGAMCYQGILFPNTRIPPQYLASSLTQLYGIACLFTTICPTLTRQSRLFQTVFVATIAVIELIAVHFLAKPTIFENYKG